MGHSQTRIVFVIENRLLDICRFLTSKVIKIHDCSRLPVSCIRTFGNLSCLVSNYVEAKG